MILIWKNKINLWNDLEYPRRVKFVKNVLIFMNFLNTKSYPQNDNKLNEFTRNNLLFQTICGQVVEVKHIT